MYFLSNDFIPKSASSVYYHQALCLPSFFELLFQTYSKGIWVRILAGVKNMQRVNC